MRERGREGGREGGRGRGGGERVTESERGREHVATYARHTKHLAFSF